MVTEIDFKTYTAPTPILRLEDIDIVFMPYYLFDTLNRRGIKLEDIDHNWESRICNILAKQDLKDLYLANIIGCSILDIKPNRNKNIDGISFPMESIDYKDLVKCDLTLGNEILSFVNTMMDVNKISFNMSNINITDTYEFKISNDVVYVLLKNNFFNGLRVNAKEFRLNFIKGTLTYLFNQLPNDRVFKSRIFKAAIQFFN